MKSVPFEEYLRAFWNLNDLIMIAFSWVYIALRLKNLYLSNIATDIVIKDIEFVDQHYEAEEIKDILILLNN